MTDTGVGGNGRQLGPVVASASAAAVEKNPKMTRKEHWGAVIAFLLTGIATALPGQLITAMLPVLTDQFLDGDKHMNTLLGVYKLFSLIPPLVLLKMGSVRAWVVETGLVLSIASTAAFAPAFFYGPKAFRSAITHILMCFTGIFHSALAVSSLACAAVIPNSYVGTYCLGVGAAGMVSFGATALLMHVVFDLRDVNHVKVFAIICSAVGVCVCIVDLVYMHFYFKSTVAVQAVEKAQRKHRKRMTDLSNRSDDDDGKQEPQPGQPVEGLPKHSKSVLWMLRVSFWPMMNTALTFFISYNLFPKVGPLNFQYENKTPESIVLLIGMFAFGDFMGRVILELANLHRWFAFLRLSKRATNISAILRILFYVPFFLAAKMEGVTVINNFAWLMVLMFLLSCSLGIVSTAALIHTTDCVHNNRDKEKMSSLATLVITLFSTAGLLVAIAY